MDRREKLEAIFKKQNMNQQDDEDIPDNEDINRIISRNENEYEFFHSLD